MLGRCRHGVHDPRLRHDSPFAGDRAAYQLGLLV